jgi:mono/diheme cytochrome c family protein
VRSAVVGAAAAGLLGSVLSAPVRSDEPISSSVTYNREVFRIFESKCLPCHAPDAVAMSLATYRDARPWARAIREELIEGRMPPWAAAPGYAAFANDIGLAARELATILTWTDGGAPRGDDRDLPSRAGSHRHAVPADNDWRIELPAQRIPAGEEHVIRRVTVDPGAVATRWIRQVDIVPGDTRVMRGAFVWVAPADGRSEARWVGAWTPWLRAMAPPGGAVFPWPRGARLVVELHYRGRETDLEDRSTLALSFAAESRTVADEIIVRTAAAPANDGGVRRRGESSVRRPTRIWALLPQASEPGLPSSRPYADSAGASLEVAARLPDGSIDVLLWIPRQRHDWPTPFILRTPVLLPAGTTVVVTATSPGGSAEPLPASAVALSTYQ